MPAPPTALPASGRFSTSVKLRLTAEILSAYLPLWVAMRREPVNRILISIRARRGAVAAPGREQYDAWRLGWAVQRTLRRLPTDNRCLIRSLVLIRVLNARGIDAQVIIGVRAGRDFAAHAWVERDGLALLPEGEYERLTVL